MLGSRNLSAVLHNPDGYPPLFGMLVHSMLLGGFDTDWWLRLPSAIAGGLAIPVVYFVGRQVASHTIAAIAAVLLAIHPMAIWYSQEVGAYSLVMLCALVSTLCFLELLRDGGLRYGFCYALCACIGFGLHYYFIFVIVAHAVVAVNDFNRRVNHRRLWLWTGLYTLGAVGVWGPYFVSDLLSQAAEDSSKPFSWLALPYTAVTFVGGFSFGPPLRELHPAMRIGASTWEAIMPYFASTLAAIMTVTGLMAISLARRLNLQNLLLLSLIIVPVFGTWLSSAVLVSYRPRYVLTALPFAVLWIVCAIETRFWRPAIALFSVFATLEVIGLAQINSPLYAREDNRSAASYVVNKNIEIPILLLGETSATFKRYAQGPNEMLSIELHHLLDKATIEKLLSNGRVDSGKLWLVSSRPWTKDPHGRLVSFLNERFAVTDERAFAGVVVQLYEDRRTMKASN